MKDKGLQSIGEILQEWLNRTPEQIEADREAEMHRERSFRRGYHQGFDAAIELIFTALDKRISIKDTYGMSALVENTIAAWRADEPEQMTPPPHFTLIELQAMLKSARAKKRGEEII